MQTYETYCSVCDASISVTLDPAADHPLAAAVLECLDRDRSCDAESCPLEGATARTLAELLEFLPSDVREPREVATESADAEDMLRQARIQAMRRGNDPVP